MSLLRQRATDVRVESSLSALRPAAARLWLVRATSCRSEEDEADPALQARVDDGVARLNADVARKATARRRTAGRWPWRPPTRLTNDILSVISRAPTGVSGVVLTVDVRSA